MNAWHTFIIRLIYVYSSCQPTEQKREGHILVGTCLIKELRNRKALLANCYWFVRYALSCRNFEGKNTNN